MILASIRPDSWNFPLLVHVAGALVLLGALVTAALAGLIGWRDGTGVLSRLSYRVLLFAALPAWFVMRIGAEWIASREGLNNLKNDPTWLGIGFITADAGGLLLLVGLLVGGYGLRRRRKGGGTGLLRVSVVLASLLVVIYTISVWAMGGKPS